MTLKKEINKLLIKLYKQEQLTLQELHNILTNPIEKVSKIELTEKVGIVYYIVHLENNRYIGDVKL